MTSALKKYTVSANEKKIEKENFLKLNIINYTEKMPQKWEAKNIIWVLYIYHSKYYIILKALLEEQIISYISLL